MDRTTSNLRSELARLCLPASRSAGGRALAWANSLCCVFLLVGVCGRPQAGIVPAHPSTEPALPALLEPPPAPPSPPVVQQLAPDSAPESERAAPARVVVVTPDSPAIRFAVPTVGNLVAPLALAAPPPLHPRAPVARLAQAPPVAPLPMMAHTGMGGDRPLPPYPTQALRRNLEGTVVLLLKADASGMITKVDVKESSCHEILSTSTVEFVRRRWTLPPGEDGRVFQVAITYRLTSG